jgi:hypothetical protein
VSLEKFKALRSGSGPQEASLGLLETATSLEDTAQRCPDGALAALALIKEGEALRAELHYRSASLAPEGLQQQLDRARACYEQALDRAGRNMTLVAMAKLGLGLCAEELEDFERAGQLYTELAMGPEFAGTVFPALAKERLELMPEYKEKVHFAEAPAPPEGQGEGLSIMAEPGFLPPGPAGSEFEPGLETPIEAGPVEPNDG